MNDTLVFDAQFMNLILFDGVCNFCNASINFVIDHDTARRFRFASLQSEYAQQLMEKHRQPILTQFDSVVLIGEEGQFFQKSDAALQIARYLRGWSWLYAFRFVPRIVRDFFYDIVARNRYRIFGKSAACRMPTPAERALFLG